MRPFWIALFVYRDLKNTQNKCSFLMTIHLLLQRIMLSLSEATKSSFSMKKRIRRTIQSKSVPHVTALILM